MLKLNKQSNRYKTIRNCAIPALLLIIITGCAHLQKNNSAKDTLRNSVVRISTTIQSPYFYSPWIWKPPQKQGGAGIVVGKDLVLTLASFVRNSKLIELTMGAEPVPVQMKVVAIDYNANLALLKGKLPKSAKAITIPSTSHFTRSGDLNLYWKTSNGRLIEGNAILDIIETKYNFDSFQAITVLKAVKGTHPNMGYGIPVFDKDNKFFGLALNGGGEYNFYIITCDTITKVLDLAKIATKEPTAVSGFLAKPLTQIYYRKKLGLAVDNGGCLISKVFGQGSGHKLLKEGDVLLSACGRKLDAWGKYTDPVHGKRSFTQLFSEHYLSETFPVTIIRDKKEIKLNLDLSTIDDSKWLIPKNPEKKAMPYFVRGGFIFLPLTKTYLTEWGNSFINKAPMNLVTTFNNNQYKIKTQEQEEFILISRVLSHSTNIGLQRISNMIIEKVNGKTVKNLSEFVDILNNSKEDILKLTLSPGGIPLLLSKKVLKSADSDIRKHYGIHSLEQSEKMK